MKKLLLILPFIFTVHCSLFTFHCYAQVRTLFITGQVKSDTGNPVPYYIITIRCDSSANTTHFGYNNVVYTNTNGNYYCTITQIPDSAKSLDFYISLLDCYSQKIIYTAHYVYGDTTLYGNFTICYKPLTCKANFRDSINQNSVQFYDNSTSSGNIVKRVWSFGDSITSTLTNPTHVYKDTGNIIVCLKIYSNDVKDTVTCYDLICKYVYIQPNDSIAQCHPYFRFHTVISDTSKLTYQFKDSSIIYGLNKNEEVKYLWQFGDGQTSRVKDPIHIYLTKGFYDICLTISVVLKADTSKIYCNNSACKYNNHIGNLHKYRIGGTVYGGSLPSSTGGTAKIYRSKFNMTIVPDTSMYFDTLSYYHFLAQWEGNYLVKILPGDNNYFPTYYGNTLMWNNSQVIAINRNLFQEDIQLVHENPNSGTGEICGKVNLNDTLNKEEIEVLLFDNNMNPFSYVLADVNRNFDFKDIAFGTYKLYTEITGWIGSYKEVSIDVNSPVKCGIDLYANLVTEIQLPASNSRFQFNIYPNPTNEKLNLNISLPNPATMRFDIINLVGKEVGTQHVVPLQKGINKVILDVVELSGGIYFLKITTANNEADVVKKFVKY